MEQILIPYIKAGFSGIWLLTQEADEAQRVLNKICKDKNWNSIHWDIDQGIKFPLKNIMIPNTNNPLSPLKMEQEEGCQVISLHNFHLFLDKAGIIQALINNIIRGKEEDLRFIILSPSLPTNIELQKLVVVLEHPLPSREQLLEKLTHIDYNEGKFEIEEEVTETAKGLTLREAENSYALSLVKHGKITKDEIWNQKVQSVKKQGFLELYKGKEDFNSIGGLQGLKDFCLRLLRKNNPVLPRGILLLGPSGTGKSLVAKCLGNQTNRPVLLMDVGRLHSKFVGSSEENIRGALNLADALSPCILFIDEVEKSLAGVSSDGDSGVSARIFGTLLTWMQDHESDVFVVCTSNDISRLPPEFSRAERFDRTFFLDLPNSSEREEIWKIHKQAYKISDLQLEVPNDDGWTGAEIKSCCRLSKSLDVSLAEASKGIIPVSVSSMEKLKALREWAKSRVCDATTGEIYSPEKLNNRKVTR